MKVELRIGKVLAAEAIPVEETAEADRAGRARLRATILAGIAESYTPDAIVAGRLPSCPISRRGR